MIWQIDPSHTTIEFAVKHMMISTVRGKFKTFDGTLNIDPDNPAASRVEGSIDTASIDTQEEQRDAHLRSADFFDVENYPKMTFRSSRIEPRGANQFKVYGQLTIKGVTREVVFDVADEGRAQDPWGNQRWGVSATTKLNRKDFGLTWNVALETGGWLVSDEIKVSVDLELVQQTQTEQAAVTA